MQALESGGGSDSESESDPDDENEPETPTPDTSAPETPKGVSFSPGTEVRIPDPRVVTPPPWRISPALAHHLALPSLTPLPNPRSKNKQLPDTEIKAAARAKRWSMVLGGKKANMKKGYDEILFR